MNKTAIFPNSAMTNLRRCPQTSMIILSQSVRNIYLFCAMKLLILCNTDIKNTRCISQRVSLRGIYLYLIIFFTYHLERLKVLIPRSFVLYLILSSQ